MLCSSVDLDQLVCCRVMTAFDCAGPCVGVAGCRLRTDCFTGFAGGTCVLCRASCFSSCFWVKGLSSGFVPGDWCILNSSVRLTPLLKCFLSMLTFCCKGVEECFQLGGVVCAIPEVGVIAEMGL